MRVLVVGASGLIGGTTAELFESSGHTVLGTYNTHGFKGLTRLDICDQQQALDIVRDFHPDLVVHASALANVDLCETEKTLCNRINVLGTQNLIDAVRAAKSRLIYLSTDYVFDGKSGPYSEKDTPNPMNFYGKCKLKAENLIQKQLDDFIIARTTVVYGWEKQGKNFVMNMIARLKRGERVKVPIDQIGTPTYVNNIAEIFLDLASKKTRGVFNVAGPELMNRYTFAKLAAKIFGLSEELLVPIKTSDLGQKAPRPLNAGMKIAKLRSVSHVQMLSPKEGLSHMRASKRD